MLADSWESKTLSRDFGSGAGAENVCTPNTLREYATIRRSQSLILPLLVCFGGSCTACTQSPGSGATHFPFFLSFFLLLLFSPSIVILIVFVCFGLATKRTAHAVNECWRRRLEENNVLVSGGGFRDNLKGKWLQP